MKNLKKIAALVIVLALALSSVSFAAYTDVSEDASYSEAVTVMSALGLLKGYEDGTFGPDKTITRAEFAAVVVRMLGMEDAAAGAATATNFTDVPATHWAAGYVKMANQKEIIAGYGDGTFGPDDEVTYEQAIKMLVCALGYAPMFADVKDAYPTSYMAQANTLGMTVGAAGKIGDKASRAVVARLVYNALDDKIMEQTSFGSEKEYGIPTLYQTPLSQYLKVAKVDATVSPVGFTAEDAAKVNLSDVSYEGAGNGSMYGGEYRDVSISDGEYDAVEGLVIPKGYAVTAFVDYNDDDMVVLAVVPKAGKNQVLEITGTQMEDGVLQFKDITVVGEDSGDPVYAEKSQLSYYKTSSEQTSKTEDVKLDENVVIYRNQDVDALNTSDYETLSANYAAGVIPSMKLINNDADAAYDVIIYTELTSGVVEEVFDANLSVSTTAGNFYFDPEDEDMTFTIADVNGKALQFADIKVNDVINVIESEDANGYSFYEYIISSDKVEGTITEMSANGDKAYIGDAEYKVDPYRSPSLKAGDKGVFYVDIVGVILDKELDASSRTFGLLYAIYNDQNGADNEVKATIYTQDGKFENFSLAKNVELVVDAGGDDTDNGTYAKTELADASDLQALIGSDAQVIMYSANSSGAINQIVKAEYIEDVAEDYSYADLSDDEKPFDALDNTWNGLEVTDSTVIVAYENSALSNTNAKEDYSISSKAIFADEEEYKAMYIVDENDELVYMVVFEAKAKVEPSNPVMVVSAAPATGETADGDAYAIIRGYVNGELKSINVDALDAYIYKAENDDEYTGVTNSNIGNIINKGAMIQYNEGDFATAVRVIVDYDTIVAIADGDITEADAWGEDYRDDEIGYLIAGQLEQYKSGNAYYYDGTKVKFSSGLNAVKLTLGTAVDDNDGVYTVINRVFGGNYTIANADTDANVSAANNDDIVITYSYDGDSLACVYIDVDNDNKK